MRPWSRRCCVAWPLSPIFHRATANQPKVVRQTRRRARPVRALRPLRRPPADPRRPGSGGRPRPAARPPGDRAARGPHRRLADGPAGLAGAGPAGDGPRLRPDRPGPGAARRRGRPDLPDPRGRLGRGLGPARAGPDRPPLGPGTGAQRPVVPRLRRPVGQHLDQPRRLPRGRPAAGHRGRAVRPVPGPGRVAHRAGPAPAWDLDGLSAAYGAWRRFAERLLDDPASELAGVDAAAPDERAFAVRSVLVHEWRKFLFTDPGLPAELLPADWAGHGAATFFAEQAARLQPAASRFVDACLAGTAPDPPDAPHPHAPETEQTGAR